MLVDVPFDMSHGGGNNNNPNPHGHQYTVKPIPRGTRKSALVFRFPDGTPDLDTSTYTKYNRCISERVKKKAEFSVGLYTFENVPGTVCLHWTELRQTSINDVEVINEVVQCLYFYSGDYVRLFIYALRDNEKPLRIDQYIKSFHSNVFFDIAPMDNKTIKPKLPKGSAYIDDKKSSSILSNAVHHKMMHTTDNNNNN